ncbi:MAG TPA: phosphoribosyltransferase [Chthonomonadaceae bacterium]|nr:phosphoribosyltransferase [Chthonomonadaceae bacterium]
MQESEVPPAQPESGRQTLFLPAWPQYNKPTSIVTLGHYYPQSQIGAANNLVREPRGVYRTEAPTEERAVRQNLGWTQLINALNAERQWPLKRLFALLDPILEPDIAIAVVPTHMAYQAFWPMRTLARQLAANGRVDATSCLVRHTTIRRITFGGPSTKALHRQTIRVENPHLVEGKRVLLLDDIAKSGASLMACREMLYEAGAALVQAMALGRVIVGAIEPE